jgi:hypothetical protein
MSTAFPFGYNVPEYEEPPSWWETGCTHLIVCTHCGKAYGICKELNERLTPKSNEENNTMDLSKHRSPKKPGAGYKRLPFLKSSDIAAKGSKAKVLDFREAPKQMQYSDFLMDVAIGKKEFTVGLRSESVLLDMLIDALGTRTEKWAGKTIDLVRGGPKGQYINVK